MIDYISQQDRIQENKENIDENIESKFKKI